MNQIKGPLCSISNPVTYFNIHCCFISCSREVKEGREKENKELELLYLKGSIVVYLRQFHC